VSKILKNNTGSIVNVTDVGRSIPASGQYTIAPEEYWQWAASSDVITYIGDLTLTVNDGSFDLNISDGVDLIKGLFPRIWKFNRTTVNVPMPLADTEYSVTLPNGTRHYRLQNREIGLLKISEVENQSGVTYETLWPGCIFEEDWIGEENFKLYFQSPKSNQTVEVVYWTKV